MQRVPVSLNSSSAAGCNALIAVESFGWASAARSNSTPSSWWAPSGTGHKSTTWSRFTSVERTATGSKRGTQFRIWATGVLRDHVVKGYSANSKRLRDLNQAVRLIADTVRRRDLSGDEAMALLAVVGEYNQALGLLDDYDHQRVGRRQQAHRCRVVHLVPRAQCGARDG